MRNPNNPVDVNPLIAEMHRDWWKYGFEDSGEVVDYVIYTARRGGFKGINRVEQIFERHPLKNFRGK